MNVVDLLNHMEQYNEPEHKVENHVSTEYVAPFPWLSVTHLVNATTTVSLPAVLGMDRLLGSLT